jgi:hypothetical protein
MQRRRKAPSLKEQTRKNLALLPASVSADFLVVLL